MKFITLKVYFEKIETSPNGLPIPTGFRYENVYINTDYITAIINVNPDLESVSYKSYVFQQGIEAPWRCLDDAGTILLNINSN